MLSLQIASEFTQVPYARADDIDWIDIQKKIQCKPMPNPTKYVVTFVIFVMACCVVRCECVYRIRRLEYIAFDAAHNTLTSHNTYDKNDNYIITSVKYTQTHTRFHIVNASQTTAHSTFYFDSESWLLLAVYVLLLIVFFLFCIHFFHYKYRIHTNICTWTYLRIIITIINNRLHMKEMVIHVSYSLWGKDDWNGAILCYCLYPNIFYRL